MLLRLTEPRSGRSACARSAGLRLAATPKAGNLKSSIATAAVPLLRLAEPRSRR